MADMTTARKIILRKAGNLLQTLLLFGLMALLLAAIGYLVAGPAGALWSVTLGLLLLFISPKVSPRMVLRIYNARALGIPDAPGLHGILRELSRRAGLERVPELHYIPSRMMNAFSVGTRESSALAVTDGLVRAMDARELSGVLAHEVSHIAHGDLRIMNLADGLSRFTSAISTIGLVMLFIYLPLYLASGILLPLPALIILLLAPAASASLQMALSRTREYEADLGAVALTGDPRGLASALMKLERYRLRIWDLLFLPGRKVPAPSMLRTHPVTEKRIARLMRLADTYEGADSRSRLRAESDGGCVLPGDCPEVTRPPRWKPWGSWH